MSKDQPETPANENAAGQETGRDQSHAAGVRESVETSTVPAPAAPQLEPAGSMRNLVPAALDSRVALTREEIVNDYATQSDLRKQALAAIDLKAELAEWKRNQPACVTEAQIEEIAMRHFMHSTDTTDRGLNIVKSALREVLELAGVRMIK